MTTSRGRPDDHHRGGLHKKTDSVNSSDAQNKATATHEITEHVHGHFPVRLRKSDLTKLLLHLTVQLHHGCGDLNCNTTTCYTYRKKHTRAPLAPYTPVTAYYIALTLAERLNAKSYLCPFVDISTSNVPARLHAAKTGSFDTLTFKLDRKALAQHLVVTDPIMALLDPGPHEPPSRWVGSHNILIQGIYRSDNDHMKDFARRLLQLITSGCSQFVRQDLQCLATVTFYCQRPEAVTLHKDAPPLSCLRHLDQLDRNRLAEHQTRILRSIFETDKVLAMSFWSGSSPGLHLSSDIYCLIRMCPGILSWMIAALEDCFLGNARTSQGEPRDLTGLHASQRVINITALIVAALCNFWPPDSVRQDSLCGTDDTTFRTVRSSVYRMLYIISRCVTTDEMPRLFDSISEFLVDERQIEAGHELTWVLWLRMAVVQHWAVDPVVFHPSATHTALMWLSSMWRYRGARKLGLAAEIFEEPRVTEKLDVYTTCHAWFHDKFRLTSGSSTFLMLDFNFLFSPQQLTQYFRGYCSHQMRAAVAATELAEEMRNRAITYIQEKDQTYLDTRMKTTRQDQLVIKSNRESALTDAFDQIWQREDRELQRPLRVRLGLDTGELGHDYGGVQIEFLNLVMTEVFDPSHSMFVTDPETHLTWLDPGSLEPLFRYELVGILIGLALYNNITLPISLPVVFYKKLLGARTTYDDLDENWPDLHKGIRDLLEYDGDVEADLGTDFVYTMNANGVRLSVLMHDPWAGNDNDDDPETGVLSVVSMQEQNPCPTNVEAAAEAGPLLGNPTIDKPPPPPVTPASQDDSHTNNDMPSSASTASEPTAAEATAVESTADVPTIQINGIDLEEQENQAGDTDSSQQHTAQPIESLIDWPGWTAISASDASPPAVTNENRLQYAQQYANWVLDYSVRPQFYAIARGIYSVVNPECVDKLFRTRPADLREFVQGASTLDIAMLKRVTTYSHDCHENMPIIKWFWDVVEAYPLERQHALLEFVTACPRLPVGSAAPTLPPADDDEDEGIRQRETGQLVPLAMFKIALDRDDNAAGDMQARLPSSSTCFRTLYLPLYANKERLKEKLDVALEHSQGFGRA